MWSCLGSWWTMTAEPDYLRNLLIFHSIFFTPHRNFHPILLLKLFNYSFWTVNSLKQAFGICYVTTRHDPAWKCSLKAVLRYKKAQLSFHTTQKSPLPSPVEMKGTNDYSMKVGLMRKVLQTLRIPTDV